MSVLDTARSYDVRPVDSTEDVSDWKKQGVFASSTIYGSKPPVQIIAKWPEASGGLVKLIRKHYRANRREVFDLTASRLGPIRVKYLGSIRTRITNHMLAGVEVTLERVDFEDE